MDTTTPLVAVRESHRFDEAKLATYLEGHLEGFSAPVEVLQVEGGQSNPTFVLSANRRQWVLRKKPPGKLLPSAHQVDREHRVQAALQNSDVPVPTMYLYCDDPSIIGTEFYVMDFVQGRLISSAALPDFGPAERTAFYDDFIRVMAALHAVDYQAAGLEDFGRPGNYYDRQIARWSKQYLASKTDEIEPMENLMKWLPENVPGGDETTIVHGDFRIGNMIVHPTEPRIIAVLDWELSTLGHPLSDLAYSAIYSYYGELQGKQDELGSLGIPSEAEYLEKYCAASGRSDVPNWHFYVAFNLFRFAAIMQGVYKRGLDGNASSERAKMMGDICRARAQAGWKLVEEMA
jgi:aminoglycoside phosphotransferase (APT) family kinase protein